jgi:hypothetical protein
VARVVCRRLEDPLVPVGGFNRERDPIKFLVELLKKSLKNSDFFEFPYF